MGGYGSTRGGSHSKRATVEDGLVLPISDTLKKALALAPGTAGTLSWSRNGEPFASIAFRREDEDGVRFLRLEYTAGSGERKRSMSYLVEMVSAPLPKGGIKWYFLCPGHSGTCRRRCSKLYKAPGAQVFACRECHRLTYTTSQESHKFDGLFKRLAQDMGGGVTPETVKRVLQERK
jgi:hypothetical protein